MVPNTSSNKYNGKTYHYFNYVCPKRKKNAPDACEHVRYWNAEALEDEVKKAVSRLVRNPDAFSAKISQQIDAELSQRDLDREAVVWQDRIRHIDRKKEGYWDLAVDGDIPKDVMRVKVAQLDKWRADCEKELAAIQDRQNRIDELEELSSVIQDEGEKDDRPVWFSLPDKDENDPDGYRKLLALMSLKAIKHKSGELVIEGNALPENFRSSERASPSRSNHIIMRGRFAHAATR